MLHFVSLKCQNLSLTQRLGQMGRFEIGSDGMIPHYIMSCFLDELIFGRSLIKGTHISV